MSADAGPRSTVGEVQFHYRKSPHFRVIYAEGAFGGVTPRGLIHFALYSERTPIPKRTSITLIDGNPAGSETTTETLGGIVREVEADVAMDLGSALSLHRWLGSKLEELRNRLGISDAEWSEAVGDSTKFSSGA